MTTRSLIVFGAFVLACARGSTTQSAEHSASTVPMQAPDTTPGWFLHEANIAGNYVKGVIGLTFHESASLADRQAAIDAVRGRVVGGWRFAPDAEGIYAVQVDDGRDLRKHQELIDRLRDTPQVRSATRVEMVTSSSALPVRSPSTVPMQSPDTTPTWFDDDTNHTEFAPRYIKHVIGVRFHDGTSLKERQAAIDHVGGTVVGGYSTSPDAEGLYAVQVDDGGDPRKHQELLERLRALPQVRTAKELELVGTSSGARVSPDSSR